MAEPNKQQIGDGSDNYGSAVNNAAKAAKQATKAGKEVAKQAAAKGAEATANAAAATVKAGVEGGKAVAEIAAGTASGGPWGAIISAAWAMRHTLFKILVCICLCVVFLIVLIVELPGILVNRALGLDGNEPVTIVTVFEAVTDKIADITGLGYDSSMTQVETLIADGGYDYELSMNALINNAQSSAGYDVAYTMGDVAWCSVHNEDRLYKEFGKNAVYLIDQVWGREPVDIPTIKKYQPESASTSSGQVLTRPYTYDETRIIIMEMVDKLVLELFEKGLTTDQIVLDVGYDIENLTDPKRRAEYKGEIVRDRYGREIPKHAGSRISLGKHTSSTKLITSKTLELFERIVDKKLLTRRLTITANHLLSVEEAKASEVAEQLTLFDTAEDVAKKEADEDREKRMQRAMLDIKTRFGPNAVMKGTSYLDAATGIERNESIGGHKA